MGFGSGKWPKRLGIRPVDAAFTGVDISYDACVMASWRNRRIPWTCVCAKGEQLPIQDASVDLVVSSLSLPYMDIPAALREIRRVLKPGGLLDASLHPFLFTLRDSLRRPFPIRALLYRPYVIANGVYFHMTGKVVRFPFSKRVESWQSQRGMTIALKQAGFEDVHCTYTADGRLLLRAHHPASLPLRAKAA